MYNKSLKISLAALGEDHPHVATIRAPVLPEKAS